VPSADQEQRDLAAIHRVLATLDQWTGDVLTSRDASSVEAGSSLAGDDRRTDPFHVSHRAWLAITVATDFLVCLKRSLVEEDRPGHANLHLQMFAPMGLLRGALENACTALWILAPRQRTERVTRRLRLHWKEIKSSDQVQALVKIQPKRTLDERRVRTIDVYTQNSTDPATRDAAKKVLQAKLGYGDIVSAVGQANSATEPEVPEFVWRMCSGLAHGDSSAATAYLDKSLVEKTAPGVNLVQLSPSVQALAFATIASTALTRQALGLYRTRSVAPH
jgi:hypothetical protein